MFKSLPGKSHAIVRRIRRNLEIPEASLVIKQALVGNVRRRSFSICFEYNCASSLHCFNISEYGIFARCFFCIAPLRHIQSCARSDAGMAEECCKRFESFGSCLNCFESIFSINSSSENGRCVSWS